MPELSPSLSASPGSCEWNAELTADKALVEQARQLWGDWLDVLLKDADVTPDDGLLVARERTALKIIIACGLAALERP